MADLGRVSRLVVDADGVQASSGEAAESADTGVVSVGSANAVGRRLGVGPRRRRVGRHALAVAVDLAVLTVRDSAFQILTIERGQEPYCGQLALPGGLVEPDENLDRAAARELEEETGLKPAGLHLEQLHAYGEPDRDPRMRIVSVCYLALMPNLPLPVAGGDARSARWLPVADLLSGERPMAFDHERIVRDAVEAARTRLEYSTLGAAFCTEPFAISDLRRVYEIVWGERLDPGNFSRKVTGVPDFLVPTGERSRDGGRPAALYRRGPATVLHPPLLRAGR